jgi:hypothetical protein
MNLWKILQFISCPSYLTHATLACPSYVLRDHTSNIWGNFWFDTEHILHLRLSTHFFLSTEDMVKRHICWDPHFCTLHSFFFVCALAPHLLRIFVNPNILRFPKYHREGITNFTPTLTICFIQKIKVIKIKYILKLYYG